MDMTSVFKNIGLFVNGPQELLSNENVLLVQFLKWVIYSIFWGFFFSPRRGHSEGENEGVLNRADRGGSLYTVRPPVV